MLDKTDDPIHCPRNGRAVQQIGWCGPRAGPRLKPGGSAASTGDHDDEPTRLRHSRLGVGAIVFFPILYGCMGFVATLIGAWLYNVVAGLVGGIEMDLQ